MIDPALAHIAGHDSTAVPFEYVREDYRCESCEREFTTTRITSCEPEHVWNARSVLAKLYTLDEARQTHRAIPLHWEGHPELADFSALTRQAHPLPI